jgi:hypothetical protein
VSFRVGSKVMGVNPELLHSVAGKFPITDGGCAL